LKEELRLAQEADIDDIIDPKETLPVLIRYLRLLKKKTIEEKPWKEH